MLKENLIVLCIITILLSCTNPDNEYVIEQGQVSNHSSVSTYSEHAQVIRDSAMRLALSASDEISVREGLRLLDEAMKLDPQSKSIFYSKMKILSDHRMRDEVFEMLKRLDTLEFNNTYSTLQLGIEYEYYNDMAMAEKKYQQAADEFYTTITTTRDLNILDRSNMLLNMAVAERLGRLKNKRVDGMLSDQDRKQLGDILNEIATRDRADILSANRLKLKTEKQP